MLFKIINKIYKIIRIYRLCILTKIINKESKNILDIGCQDFFFYSKLKGSFDITLADAYPKNEKIKKEQIESLSFGDKIFDTVICLEVLEHTHDPVKAIKELQRVTRKDLIISIPNEPFFSLFRLLFWEKEHLWAITPKVLKYYLGIPKFEKTFCLRRYYIAKWSF